METNFIDSRQRTWAAMRRELEHGGDPEVLARMDHELNETADAAKRAHRETLASKISRTDPSLPGSTSTDREAAGVFWTWARFGKEGRTDALQELGFGGEPEQKWADARRRTGLRLEQKALNIADDSTGGFLAPSEYVAELIKAIVLVSPMREICRVRTTVNKSVQQPKRVSTAAAVWVADGAARTETTNPSYGMAEIPTHELTGIADVTFADLEDSAFDLEAELTSEFGEQFGFSEGQAILSGNGIGKPLGLLDPGSNIAFTTTGTSGSIASSAGAKGDALIALCHAVKTPYAKAGRFIMNRATLGSVRKLADSQGRYLWDPGLGASPGTILGYPYTEVPDVPAEAANSLSVVFGDFARAYTIVDRISMSMLRDPYSQASGGKVRFLARRRVGGQLVLNEAVRALKCI